MRHGRYERDLWASVIRFGQTNGAVTTINNLSPNTIVTRSPKGGIGIGIGASSLTTRGILPSFFFFSIKST